MLISSQMMLGEFLCANVSAPWVLFMVQCKLVFPHKNASIQPFLAFEISEDEAEVGYWTGSVYSFYSTVIFIIN